MVRLFSSKKINYERKGCLCVTFYFNSCIRIKKAMIKRRFTWEFEGDETCIDGEQYFFEKKAITGRYVYAKKINYNDF